MARLIDVKDWDSFYADMGDSRNMADSYDRGYTDALDRVDDWMDAQPTVDAVPVVHGRWVLIEEGQNTSVYQCSKCNRMVNVVCDRNLRKRQLAKNYPYCNCGAKMDLEVE